MTTLANPSKIWEHIQNTAALSTPRLAPGPVGQLLVDWSCILCMQNWLMYVPYRVQAAAAAAAAAAQHLNIQLRADHLSYAG